MYKTLKLNFNNAIYEHRTDNPKKIKECLEDAGININDLLFSAVNGKDRINTLKKTGSGIEGRDVIPTEPLTQIHKYLDEESPSCIAVYDGTQLNDTLIGDYDFNEEDLIGSDVYKFKDIKNKRKSLVAIIDIRWD